MTYANGQAPEATLVTLDGLHTVPSIVARVTALIAYAATQGRTVRVAHWYGSYRNLAEQRALSGTGNAGSTVPVAAAGFSTHGIYDVGRVDLVGADGFTYTTALLNWLVAVTPAFGLAREFGDRDPNHFMAVGDFAPAAAIARRSPMYVGLNYNVPNAHQNAKVIVDLIGFHYYYPTGTEISVWGQQGGSFSNVDDPMWTAILSPRQQVSSLADLVKPVSGAPIDQAALVAALIAGLIPQLVPQLVAQLPTPVFPTKIEGVLS